MAAVGVSTAAEWELRRFVDRIGNTEIVAGGVGPPEGQSVSTEDAEEVRGVLAKASRSELDPQWTGPPDESAAAHEANACKPCIFDYHGVCTRGDVCRHCHLRHSALELRRAQPSRLKRDRLRSRLGEVSGGEASLLWAPDPSP